jgi:hypothetical protein
MNSASSTCWALGALALLLSGCVQPADYTALRAHRPRSILVPPPLNESTETAATYGYLSTVTQPLAEQGYYVFPVAVMDQFFRENGLPTAYEIHQIPLKKIEEIVGADAVLYTRVKQYGTKYMILSSVTVVEVEAKLVDVKTGTTLWENKILHQVNSGDSGGGLIGAVVTAAVSQALNSSTDQAHSLCPAANTQLFRLKNRGLLYGPRHPNYLSEPLP